MNKSTILLVCSDEEYVASVEGYLAKSILKNFRLEFITDQEYLMKYLEVPHKIEVLVIEDKLLPLFPQNQSLGKVFIITESDKIGANQISKYLGAQGIVKLLGPAYMTNEAGGEQLKTRIHDVVALNNPAFKTLTALALSAQLANYGKKVLYLSADNMQTFGDVLFEGENTVISQESQALAITAIINGDIRNRDTLITKGDFDYIPQFGHFLSSYGMSAATIFSLAEAIRRLEIYDEIVIEHPFGFVADSVARLEKSKSIVITTGQDKISYDKLKMLFSNTREVEDNCVLVCFPYEKAAPDFVGKMDEDKGIVCERIGTLKAIGSLKELVEKQVFKSTAEAVL